MFDETKLNVIREYLRKEFNSTNITDIKDSLGQKYRIDESNRIYILIFTTKFIEDNDATSIPSQLKRVNLKNRFDDEKVKTILFAGLGEEIVTLWD